MIISSVLNCWSHVLLTLTPRPALSLPQLNLLFTLKKTSQTSSQPSSSQLHVSLLMNRIEQPRLPVPDQCIIKSTPSILPQYRSCVLYLRHVVPPSFILLLEASATSSRHKPSILNFHYGTDTYADFPIIHAVVF